MADTSIEWTDATWNPVTGCSKVASGCRSCYAEAIAKRFWGDRKFTDVQTHPDRLDQPLHWRRPRRVFVNSMSDLFHEDVPFGFIVAVYGVMAACPQHTFQILTKRPERMLEFFKEWWYGTSPSTLPEGFTGNRLMYALANALNVAPATLPRSDADFPLPNVWHGTSIAEPRDLPNVDILLQVPSAVRFVSAEPLIGDVWLGRYLGMPGLRSGHQFGRCANCGKEPGVRPDTRTNDEGEWLCSEACGDQDEELGCALEHKPLDWVIVGGESGPGARPCDVAWIRSIVQQCKAAGVACFVKQLGAVPVDRAYDLNWEPGHVPGQFHALAYADGGHPLKDRKGGSPEEWPQDLRVREFPEVKHASL